MVLFGAGNRRITLSDACFGRSWCRRRNCSSRSSFLESTNVRYRLAPRSFSIRICIAAGDGATCGIAEIWQRHVLTTRASAGKAALADSRPCRNDCRMKGLGMMRPPCLHQTCRTTRLATKSGAAPSDWRVSVRCTFGCTYGNRGNCPSFEPRIAALVDTALSPSAEALAATRVVRLSA
jgi:hypothetical protein